MHFEEILAQEKQLNHREKKFYGEAIVFFLLSIGSTYLSFYNYLLFHTTIELLGIIIMIMMTMIVVNTHKFNKDHYLMLLGVAYGFVAIWDLLHTLAYDSLGIFSMSTTNLTIQLWIVARYIEAISIFIAVNFLKSHKKIKISYLIFVYGITSVFALLSIFSWNIFPKCFIEDKGLTAFKVISQYMIIGIIAVSIIMMIRNKNRLDKKSFWLLIFSSIATIASEITLCYFKSPQDMYITIGHIFKILSFYLIYKAIVETSLKNPYEKLASSEERYRSVVELLPTGVCVYTGGKISFVNPALCKMLGAATQELFLDKDLLDIIHPEDHALVEARMKRVKQGEVAVTDEERLITVEGKTLYVEVISKLVPFENQEAIVAIVRNISMDKHAEALEKHIVYKQKELQQSIKQEELKTEFFSNLSHEMRTPLNVIFGIVQLLELQGITGDAMKKHIKALKQNCYRMLKLINNLLDITKIDVGYFQVSLENYNIVEVIEDITMSIAPYAENNHINVIFDTNVEEKYMAVDLNSIERIMMNLLSNAIKFTEEEGKITVSFEDKGEIVTILVEDTGEGIPADQLPFIFDRFRQVDKSTRKNQQGSGIGLSLVESLVKIHGGSIEVRSEVGSGTEFAIELPATLQAQKEKRMNVGEIDIKNKYVEKIHIEFSDIYHADSKTRH
ncbi:sensor histidine kinase ResE [Clostridium aceticum]|uniref:histidine kinase n=1 Tax=Clostridium aceticum TaxID=84022 RepID=A0A0D8IEE7_9CLOT|nr:MASE3 domain-containing protein [Clostridium aceticum]AKL93963.1 sensor histidine kinase ResE [Clostridium aceticum]KJF28653.1 hypothetical protein TZ02_01765 [Clostridium aceticum]